MNPFFVEEASFGWTHVPLHLLPVPQTHYPFPSKVTSSTFPRLLISRSKQFPVKKMWGLGLGLPGSQDNSESFQTSSNTHEDQPEQNHTNSMPSAYLRDNTKSFGLPVDRKISMNPTQSHFLSYYCRELGGRRANSGKATWKTEVKAELTACPEREKSISNVKAPEKEPAEVGGLQDRL